LADHLRRLLPPTVRLKPDTTTDQRSVRLQADEHETRILDYLRDHGASFFASVHEATGGGYPADSVNALWNLVWRGLITNDTFHALRALTLSRAPRRRARRGEPSAFRSRRLVPPAAEGRWSLV